jgi:hypothetical protein
MGSHRRKFNPYKWHIISTGQLPRWVKKKWGIPPYEQRPSEDGHFGIDAPPMPRHYHVKGRHYEYKETVVVTRGWMGATHDSVIVRRKLKPVKK